MIRDALSFLVLFSLLALLAGCASAPHVYTPLENELIDSLKRPNSEKLEKSLAQKVDPNLKDRDGTPVLMLAAILRKYDAMEILLKNGANPDLADADGDFPIHAAASSRSSDLLLLLLRKKATPDIPGKYGRTALMEAARLGRIENVNVLLQAGADPKVADELGRPVLYYAALAKENGADVIRALQKSAPDLYDRPIPFEYTPILVALDAKNTETAHFLLDLAVGEKIDTPEKIVVGLAAMRLAILNNDRKSVEALVKLGLPLNYDIALAFKAAKLVNVGGVYKFCVRNSLLEASYSPLIWAAIYGRPEIAGYLVSQGADPYRESNEGRDAFDYANDPETADAIRKNIPKK